MTKYVGMSAGTDRNISISSCSILESNLTQNSPIFSFSGSGRTMDREFNYQKALEKSPNIDQNYTKRYE